VTKSRRTDSARRHCLGFSGERKCADTIRDTILMCARKRTRVSLIYRKEPTTKKWKTEKLKSKKRICSEVSVNSPGNPCSQSSAALKSLARRKREQRCVINLAAAVAISAAAVQRQAMTPLIARIARGLQEIMRRLVHLL